MRPVERLACAETMQRDDWQEALERFLEDTPGARGVVLISRTGFPLVDLFRAPAPVPDVPRLGTHAAMVATTMAAMEAAMEQLGAEAVEAVVARTRHGRLTLMAVDDELLLAILMEPHMGLQPAAAVLESCLTSLRCRGMA